MQPTKRSVIVQAATAQIPQLNGNLFRKPEPVLVKPVVLAPVPVVTRSDGKTREQILYERYMPKQMLDFFITNLREVAEGLVADNPVKFSKVAFLVNKNDKVDVWINNKRIFDCDKEIITKELNDKLTLEYFMVTLELELNLFKHGRPQKIEVKKNKQVLFSQTVRIDDALQPIVNLKSFIGSVENNRIKFEAYYKYSFCSKRCFRIFVNEEEIEFTYSVNKNIVTAVFDPIENIRTVEVWVYNSKGEYVSEKIDLTDPIYTSLIVK
jgi:hypothetical protein